MKTGEWCPKCDIGKMIVKNGRYGEFLSCDRFPRCDYMEKLKKFETKDDILDKQTDEWLRLHTS